MKQTSFKKVGWIYLVGILITLGAIVFMVPVCMAVFRNVHSAGDGIYEISIYATCTAFWSKWIAEKNS